MASEDDMNKLVVDPNRGRTLIENIHGILKRIDNANRSGGKVRLIAVSKLHPATDILALHKPQPSFIPQDIPHPPAQLHFGENYLQELEAKAALLPRSIHWHFIGALQSNKCKALAQKIPNLYSVSSVDTAKKADELEKGRDALAKSLEERRQNGEEAEDVERLRVMVQVNTSGEAEKSGCEPQDATDLAKHVMEKCPHLKLGGLMTIGAIARSQATTEENENEDFIKLKEVRDKVAGDLGVEQESLELSMGMSADFESAIRLGSNEVRVGSDIFGQRPPRKEAKRGI
ncbi:hypothetical protein M501DRAFT_1006272 [Patellaria atrata CBS 101060]|uniref:Pyridoxal phosphate homeostasis protein n=1 Tax=Patellaria atrata CBS 101060 TaxID=1346257 RepID=A0A9P4S9U3_9PEZI|nr:hypothetical protein M501DRAFT_1006272 [Patellaria atrata CBS 101060]